MSHFMRVFRERLVVEVLSRFGVQREVELIFPAELKARARERIIADLRGGVALGKVGGCLLYTSPSPRDRG